MEHRGSGCVTSGYAQDIHARVEVLATMPDQVIRNGVPRASAGKSAQDREGCANASGQAIALMVLRKRASASPNKVAPIRVMARNCGHTTARPAPR